MPSVFPCLTNDVLRDMFGRFVIAYIDDIPIYSSDIESHNNHIMVVLSKLLCNHLFVKAKKCKLHLTQVSFWDNIISAQGINMGQDKVSAVTTWPTPTIIKELQCFLSFAIFFKIGDS